MSSRTRSSEAGPQEKALIVLLRFSAIVLLLAFPMMLLPVEWMARSSSVVQARPARGLAVGSQLEYATAAMLDAAVRRRTSL